MSVVMIGERRDDGPNCGAEHLPGCYNPWSGTYCVCGAVRWSGDVGTWHCRPLHEAGPNSPRLGWDVYFMHADYCDQRHESGLCCPSVPFALPLVGASA